MRYMAWQDDARRVIADYSCIRLAVVFGSTARGRSRRDSDIDIGVLLDESGPDIAQALEVDLARALGRTVDLIVLNTAPPLLRFEVAREGEVLVARDEYEWTDFKARAMVDWWDWAPTARRLHAAAAARLR
jgi:predicted nucleotidyltransferase